MKADDMNGILIKPQYHNTVIAFNNSGVVLKDRSDQDIIDLGIMAHRSGNPNLMKLFETLPSLSELQAMRIRGIEKKVMPAAKAKPAKTDKGEKTGKELHEQKNRQKAGRQSKGRGRQQNSE